MKRISGLSIWLTIFILLISLVSGCIDTEEKELQESIRNYNKNLVMALKSQNPELLEGVATGREIGGFTLFLARLQDQGRIMDARLLELNFDGHEVTDLKNGSGVNPAGAEKTAKVRTTEVWSYDYLDSESRQVVEGPVKIRYLAEYFLEKTEGRWLVSDMKFTEEEV